MVALQRHESSAPASKWRLPATTPLWHARAMSGSVNNPLARTMTATLLIVALGLQLIMATANAARPVASADGPDTATNLTSIIICTFNGPRLVRIDADGQPVDNEPLPAGPACPVCGNLFQNALLSPAASLIVPASTYLTQRPGCHTLAPPSGSTHLRPPGRAPPLTV